MTTLDFNCTEAILLDTPTVSTVMANIAALGSTHVRVAVPWGSIHTAAGVFDPTLVAKLDGVVAAASAHGLVPDFVVCAPQAKFGFWIFAALATPTDFAAFCTWLVGRYKPQGVHTYELWNEANNAASWGSGGFNLFGAWLLPPHTDVAQYATYVKAGSAAIRKADPSAAVVLGGIMATVDGPGGVCTDSVTWLQAVYAQGCRGCFDVVAYHAYTSENGGAFKPQDPINADGTLHPFVANIGKLRAVMDAQGDTAMPIWVNEFGYSTAEQTDAVAAQRASTLTTYLRSIPSVARLYYYQYRNWTFPGTAYAATAKDQNWGIVDAAFKTKAALMAWAGSVNH